MKYIFRELLRHRWRTIAGISGYVVAVLFIMLVLSVSRPGGRISSGIMKGTGTHFIVYIPGTTSCCVSFSGDCNTGSPVEEGAFTLMLNSSLLYSIRDLEGVRDASPYLLYSVRDEKRGTGVALGGIDTNSIAAMNNVCSKSNLTAGNFISGVPGEVVAEESFATSHRLSVGDTLKIYGGRMVVAGIVNSGIKPGKADLYATVENVRLLLSDSLKCISEGYDMNIVLVEVTNASVRSKVIRQISDMMGYLTASNYNCYQPADDVMEFMDKSTAILIAVIFLLLLIFSARTQLTLLMERIREAGILKSLGWSNLRLGMQIIGISLTQAFAGTLLGIIAGLLIVGIAGIYKVRFFDPEDFSFHYIRLLVPAGLAVAGGLVAAAFPVIRICRTRAGEMIDNNK